MTAMDDRNYARDKIEKLRQEETVLIARIERDTSTARRARKPAPKAWSLVEVVQHLGLVAGAMFRTRRPAKRRPAMLGAAKSAILAKALRSSLKIPAPVRAIVPASGVTWEEARSTLSSANEMWSAFVDDESFDHTDFLHPLLGRLTPAETALFLVDHFEHHTRQVERLFAEL
jgi:hypothetical protein